MSFLTPFFLIGLGALAVPIIIHLWSKDAKRTVSFGSLRFLRETETRTTRSIMPSQWLLLILRLLILALIVFLLAGMQLVTDQKKVPRIYLVDRFYQNSELLSNLMDTVEEGVEVRWLADNFPSIEEPIQSKSSDYWDLLNNLPTAEAECTIVISPLHQKEFVGKRKKLPSICQWIKPPGEVKSTQLALLRKNDDFYALMASYDEWSTTHILEESDKGQPVEIAYYLHASTYYESLEQILKAALTSIQNISMVTLKKTDSLDQADWVIWLSDESIPANKKVIAIDSEVFGWTQIGDDLIKVSSKLTSEEAIRMELPRKLLDAFAADYFDGNENDLLTLDMNGFTFKSEGEKQFSATLDAASYLWIILVTVLLVERWLSYKSNMVSG